MFFVTMMALSTPSQARLLAVGPGQPFARPSEAAAVAQDGDIVAIAPGTYFDCAVWRANRLAIVAAGADTGTDTGTDTGSGGEVLITDSTCGGKAVFVIDGADVIVRGLTFARARVAEGNGAGIRAEGGDLSVERCRFVDNQVGILAAGTPGTTLRISGSRFESNGAGAHDEGQNGGSGHLAAISVGLLALLRIETSAFEGRRSGSDVVSRAQATVLRGNSFSGNWANPAVAIPDGGRLEIEGNRFAFGPPVAGSLPMGAPLAVLATADGGWPGTMALRRNVLTNASGRPALLLLNQTGADAILEGNGIALGDREWSGRGAWAHRQRAWLRRSMATARLWAGILKHGLRASLAQL